MPLLIAHAVHHDPEDKNSGSNNGKTMTLEERTVLSFAKPDFQISPRFAFRGLACSLEEKAPGTSGLYRANSAHQIMDRNVKRAEAFEVFSMARAIAQRWQIILLLLVTNLFTSIAAGQQAADTQAADELFAQSKWEQAAQAYAQITAKERAPGQAWQNLGECYLHLSKFDQARQAFSSAAAQKFRPLLNKVNVARAYAAAGESARAISVLNEVAVTGKASGLRGYIAGAGELQKLASLPEYKLVLQSLRPCQAAEFHSFDFWVGDWAVQNPAGQRVGENQVTREQEGCLLVEHWKSGRGVETGTSFNYYDINDKKWHQLYISNSGDAGAFPPMAGNLIENKMVLISDEEASPVFRWTWYVISPGKVRQMAEQSNDSQKTWQTVWDSVYVSKPEQAFK
jgi:tetratricopeptide (TPR) repeat protein